MTQIHIIIAKEKHILSEMEEAPQFGNKKKFELETVLYAYSPESILSVHQLLIRDYSMHSF